MWNEAAHRSGNVSDGGTVTGSTPRSSDIMQPIRKLLCDTHKFPHCRRHLRSEASQVDLVFLYFSRVVRVAFLGWHELPEKATNVLERLPIGV